jgi:bifunctional DNA-binding transcriptional regulator/antitoxin component of YhaV-PrlF toxin-antitoxin module
MLQSKISANGSTTLPKPVRDVLGVEVGDTVRNVISEDGVQIVEAQSVSETVGIFARNGQP